MCTRIGCEETVQKGKRKVVRGRGVNGRRGKQKGIDVEREKMSRLGCSMGHNASQSQYDIFPLKNSQVEVMHTRLHLATHTDALTELQQSRCHVYPPVFLCCCS